MPGKQPVNPQQNSEQTNAHRSSLTPVRVIIVAAGSGSRFGAATPKQFCDLAGRPVLMWTIEGLKRTLPQAQILVVLSGAMIPFWQELCERNNFASPQIIPGGETRWHSVHNALSATAGHNGLTLVHDGARPITDTDAIHAVLATAAKHGACVPVTSVTDSLRRQDSTGATHAVKRSEYLAVQTPQGFDSELLEHAYALPYSPAFTDDASVVEAAGHTVATSPGNADNIKITNPGDTDIARIYLIRRSLVAAYNKR